MASLGATYDASQGEQMSDRSALPAGEYLAAIAKSDVGPDQEGRRAQGRSRVRGPRRRAQGPRFWTTLNLWNPNPQTVEIAQRELNSICHAVGKLRVADTEELHGIPMMVTLGFQTGQRRANDAEGLQAGGRTRPGGPPRGSPGGKPRGPWA